MGGKEGMSGEERMERRGPGLAAVPSAWSPASVTFSSLRRCERGLEMLSSGGRAGSAPQDGGAKER